MCRQSNELCLKDFEYIKSLIEFAKDGVREGEMLLWLGGPR